MDQEVKREWRGRGPEHWQHLEFQHPGTSLTWSHLEWEKHPSWRLCLPWSLFCTYEWSDEQVCTSALSLRRLCRVPDCISQQICVPCSKMPMGSKHWAWATKGYSTKSHGYFQSKCKLQGKSSNGPTAELTLPQLMLLVCLSVCLPHPHLLQCK